MELLIKNMRGTDGENDIEKNATRTKCFTDKISHDQNVAQAKFHTEKISQKNVTQKCHRAGMYVSSTLCIVFYE